MNRPAKVPGRLLSMPPPGGEVRSVESLRHIVPAEYRQWVKAAVIASSFGYGLVLCLALVFEDLPVWHRTEAYALVACLVALVSERASKPLLAAYLILLAATAEILASFFFSPVGLSGYGLAVPPVLVLVAGMFLGSRLAYFFAVGLSVTIPLVTHWGGLSGHGAGLAPGDGLSIASVPVILLITAFLFHMFLRSFSGLLFAARENARQAAAEVIDSAPDGMLVVSPEGTIDSANEYAARFLGIPIENLWGTRPEDLPICPIEDPQGELEVRELAIAGSAKVFLSPDTQLGLEVRVRPISGAHADASWLVLLRDVTERLDAEHRERELAVQLRHAQKLEAVGQLAGGVAHDFNNLLTVVAGYADFVEDMEDEGAAEAAEQLRATYQRGNLLTKQLLAFARREMASPSPLDLAHLVQGLEKLLVRVVGEQVRCEIDANEECPIVIDRGQAEQVIINLAANARDAMAGGGTFRIAVRREGYDVVLEASDTGTGIDSEIQSRIFDPFFTTKPRGKGTGLGLSTVHGIVTQSHGTIGVDSELGQGTTFQIRWPVTERSLRPLTSPQRSAPPRTGRGRILFAEDDPQMRRFIHRVLKEAGFEVVEAQDGAEALSLAVNLPRAPDLFLSDIVMPGMSGVEFIQRVRRQYPEAPFLFMSGYTDNELDPNEFDIAKDLLLKPFGRDELLERIFQKIRPSDNGTAVRAV